MSVGKVCVRTVVTARPDETIDTAAKRVVVVSPTQELVGLFALDDMLELLGEEQQAIAELMRASQGL